MSRLRLRRVLVDQPSVVRLFRYAPAHFQEQRQARRRIHGHPSTHEKDQRTIPMGIQQLTRNVHTSKPHRHNPITAVTAPAYTVSAAKGRIRERATSALAFLEQFAGTGSRWTVDAHDVFNNSGETQSMESGARAVGDVLTEWASMVRSGQTQPLLPESFTVRAASSGCGC